MRCGLCQRELTVSITGSLMKYACSVCTVYYIELMDERPNPDDLWQIIKQVTRKEPHDRTQE